jgi:hypothetical protein
MHPSIPLSTAIAPTNLPRLSRGHNNVILRCLGAAVGMLVTATPFTSQITAQGLNGICALRVAGGFDRPLYVTAPPGDTTRLFVVQQTGQIRIIHLPARTVNATPFLDIASEITIAGNEQGLLGLAFDPSYPANGRFYLNYTAPGGVWDQGVTHIARFTVSSDPDIADPASELTVLTYDQPQTNHNGGWLGFSPRVGDDNNLYVASGDGGHFNDEGIGHIEPGGNAQSTQTLLGKMLRIHIEDSGAYSIPPDNPFAGSDTDAQEVWTFGLRNPYRDSFDRVTGTLFIADVGQMSREEVDVQLSSNPGGGENYGWRVREGLIQNPAYPNDPPPPDAVDPIIDYPHTTGQTVIGGYVYRGRQLPPLRGLYVFADYLGPEGGDGHGRIFTLRFDGHVASHFQDITSKLFPTPIGNYPLDNPSSLGEDANGELYITDISNGNVYRITRRPSL